MTDKPIVIRPQGKPAPADRRALADKSREEFERRAQALWRASGKTDRRIVPFRCAVTGRHFHIEFDRSGPFDLYRIISIEKGVAQSARPGQAGQAAPSMELKDFDLSGWRCPYCASDNFCRCGCGETVCQGRTRDQGNGVLQFNCHVGCGRWGWTVPYDKMHPSDSSGRSGTGRNALPDRGRPALPNRGNPRLGKPG